MALFTGTELVIGVLLAAWLLWVGLGGLLGGRLVAGIERKGYPLFAWLAGFVALLLPLTVILIRLTRGSVVRPPGSLPPFLTALALSVCLIAPYGFVYGTIYNVASDLWRRGEGGLPAGVSRVYIWEAAGSIAGAAAFSFLLLPLMSQLEASFVIAFLLFASVILRFGGGSFRIGRAVLLAALAVVLATAVPWIDGRSIGGVFPGYRVERFLSSRYGEIVAAYREEVLSFFSGGGRLFSVPEPERAEEAVHFPLLLHGEPKDVLLIGGSLGGGWREVVKHPSVGRVDCLELDGELLELALEMEGGEGGSAADALREAEEHGVRFIRGDGRFHLSRGLRRYDVIILNAPPPLTLQWNRYYTREFFGLVRRSLLPGGIFALAHPSSENFISPEQARVLGSLDATMRDAFPEVTLLPGGTVHFIGGEEAFDTGALLPRLEERKIATRYVNADFLPYRFSEERFGFLEESIRQARGAGVNRDGRPTLPLYELFLESRRVGAGFVGALKRFQNIPAFLPAAVIGGVLFLLMITVRGGAAARLAVWTVGFCGFLLQLMILLSYQSFSGILYHSVVLMTALFMAGASGGAWVSLSRGRGGRGSLRLVHLCFVALALALLGWLHLVRQLNVPYAAGAAGFLSFSACGGFLTGFYYPVVVRLALPTGRGAVPATFYAWDLFGACLGGLLGGLLFFPILGVAGTVLFFIVVHSASSILLAARV